MNEEYPDLPEPFVFYRHMLKSDHLHFGLWPENSRQLSMEEAQEAMFERLLSYFPPPPARVLDVGCGLGYSAHLLSEKGYEVTAVAPSAELIAYARHKYENDNVRFVESDFFKADPVLSENLYDVLFFQESMQYLSPLSAVLERSRKLLKEKGVLIMGDEVCYNVRIRHLTAVHMAADFTVAFSERGFRITGREVIGRQVSPTCEFVIKQFTENFDALASLGGKDMREQLLHYLDGWKNQSRWYAEGDMGYELIAARKDSYFIRPYAAGDEQTILPAFNRIFHTNRSMEHWQWKFNNNPYGSRKVTIAFSDEFPLAAHYAGYPVPFCSSLAGQETLTAFQIGDTMTIPEVRKIGLGKTGLLSRTAHYFYAKYCEGAVPFIYGFNTGHIRKLGTRFMGYSYIDPVTLWVRDVGRSPFSPLPLLSRLFSGYLVEEVHAVDKEWTAFFDRVRDSYEFLVLRDEAYVRWRYLECPDKTHRIFSVRRRGYLVGWSVFIFDGTRIIWGDALFDNKYRKAVPALMHHLCTREVPDAKSIEAWFPPNPNWWNMRLRDLGFETAEEPDKLTPGFVVFGNPSLMDTFHNHLYYTKGDSDLF